MPWRNGEIPYDIVSVVLASGTDENGYWEFRCTPATAARWAFAKQYALEHFGRTIYVRTGWNIYRPIASQWVARNNACADGNCAGAAYPGSSSHGGDWNGRMCLAVDVDPNGMSWAQVDEAMIAAGFSAGLITAAISSFPGGEPWHYIDFNAFGAVPAFEGSTPFEEDDMQLTDRILVRGGTASVTVGEALARAFDVYDATFVGGISMPDNGRPIKDSIDGIVRVVDRIAAKVAVPPTLDVDETALAAALAPLIPRLSELSDPDVARLAVAAADEQDRRDRKRLGTAG